MGGLLILLVFAIAAGLMIARVMPALLALPLMAVSVALVAGVCAGLPWATASPEQPSLSTLLFQTVLTEGAAKLAPAMILSIFGAILSQVVMRQGIAQRIVRIAAEYAGDKKLLLAFLMTMAVAVNFTSLSGLGAIIMIGSLVLPILVGSGLSPAFAGTLVLFGMSLGGLFNLANYALYLTVLKMTLEEVRHLALHFGCIFLAVIIAYLVIEGRAEQKRFAWAAVEEVESPPVPVLALFTPLLPIVLSFALNSAVPAFIAGILYGCLTTQPRRLIANLSAATLEGLRDVSPVLGLFIGIGMTFRAVTDPTTIAIMAPFIQAITPTSVLGYVAFFTLLAPLSLYRGPLNLYGLGSGFATLLAGSNALPSQAIMSAFLCVGQMQSVCDPTNTHNVWVAQFVHGTTDQFLKKTLPYVWVFVLVALTYGVTALGVMNR